jgi:hypothetical protein
VATHDYVIANGTGAAVRSDLNDALAAIVSQNSSSTAPSATYAYMKWADISAGTMKMRNGTNSAWISLYELDGTFVSDISLPTGTAASPGLYFTGDVNTGIYSPGADQLAISTGGTGRVFVDSNGRLLVATSSSVNVIGQPSSIQVESTATVLHGASFIRHGSTAAAAGAVLSLGRSRGSTVGSLDTVANGDTLGYLAFFGANGTDFSNAAAWITGEVDGNVDYGGTDMPGRLVFSTTADGTASPTERMRIDSRGGILAGTSSARNNLYGAINYSPTIQIEAAGPFGSLKSMLSICNNSTIGASPTLALISSGANSIGAVTVVANGAGLGIVDFLGTDGTNPISGAAIKAFVDGTPGTNDMPGRLVFSTTPSGSASPTERMRIDSSGRILAGKTASSFATTGVELAANINSGGWNMFSTSTAATSDEGNIACNQATSGAWVVKVHTGGTGIGGVRLNGLTGTSFATTSDYRLKENIVSSANAINRLQQLSVYRFNFIVEPEKTVDGFIAHEVATVVPEAISGDKDAVNEDGAIQPQCIDQSKLVPLLTAALQEAIARIETLEARLSALEGA